MKPASTRDATSRLVMDPDSAWADRLQAAGLVPSFAPTASTALNDFAGAGVPLRLNDVGGWESVEQFLWNQLLPKQHSSGVFQDQTRTHEECAADLNSILASAAEATSERVEWRMPISAALALSGGSILRMQSEYPVQGRIRLAVHGGWTGKVLIRIPFPDESVQLTRRGSSRPLQWRPPCLLLEGPWEDGETAQIRFGVPFRVLGASRKPITRSYPGAADIKNGQLFHGMRQLIPRTPTNSLGVGVRKDGVLLLQRGREGSEKSGQRELDTYLTPEEPPQILLPRALGGLLETPFSENGFRIRFLPFVTAFDRGA